MVTKLIELDFTEHDTIEAFEYFLQMARDHKIAGALVALSLRNKRKHNHMFGVTGRLASDATEAAGLAGMLHLQMVQSALEND